MQRDTVRAANAMLLILMVRYDEHRRRILRRHSSLHCGWTVPAAPRLRRLSTGFAGLGVLRLNTFADDLIHNKSRTPATLA